MEIVRPRRSELSAEVSIDDLIQMLSEENGIGEEMADARKWLASNMSCDLGQLRLQRGLSQAQLAEKVGLRQPNISAIEAGKRKPEYETARKIASVLGISMDDFYAAFDKSLRN
jgi:DNA-binding XRE family transcriptional regulator